MAAAPYARYIPSKSVTASKRSLAEQSTSPTPAPRKPDQSKHNVEDDARDGAEERPRKKRKAKAVEYENVTEDVPSKKHERVLAKFNRSSKISERLKKEVEIALDKTNDQKNESTIELHGLEPIPQPPPTTSQPEYVPSFSALPKWLSEPVFARPTDRATFRSLSLSDSIVTNLEKNGYEDTFPVQTKLLPLLLPGISLHNGDICVSAPTGSGKTLGYLLPIIDRIKDSLETRLRAIVVVPTRELVSQARQVAIMAATGTSVQIGTAVGNVSRVVEESQLIQQEQTYNPDKYPLLIKEAKRRFETGFLEDDKLFEDIETLLPNHIRSYRSKVDILICTPGRLVEHISSTHGFSLQHLKYLVIDEADKLLDESFQEWIDMILKTVEHSASKNVVQKFLSKSPRLDYQNPPRKIVLSATMTRDIGKLTSLKLRTPALVVVANEAEHDVTAELTQPNEKIKEAGEMIELPSNLKELAVPVGNGADKPLYLLQLLKQLLDAENAHRAIAKILVFVHTTEDTMRLQHILVTLRPDLADKIEGLTKASSKNGRKVLSALQAGKINVLLATDRASRGLDVADLTDVISYDMPRSVTDYIHRVGRTARAGRSGTSWTFFTDSEGRWFWNAIARSEKVRRDQGKIERRRVDPDTNQEIKVKYEQALEALKNAVLTKR